MKEQSRLCSKLDNKDIKQDEKNAGFLQGKSS